MRTVAMILNLFSWVLVVVFIGIGIENNGNNIALIAGPVVLAVLMVFVLKAEYDFVDDNRNLLLVVVLLAGIAIDVAIGYTMITDPTLDVWLFYTPVLVALFLIIYSWHYTLTIYKKEMQKHLIGYLLFAGVFLGFGATTIGFLILIPVMLNTFAIILNLYAVVELTQKKLLKLID